MDRLGWRRARRGCYLGGRIICRIVAATREHGSSDPATQSPLRPDADHVYLPAGWRFLGFICLRRPEAQYLPPKAPDYLLPRGTTIVDQAHVRAPRTMAAMDVFDLHPQTRFVIGDDRIDTLGELAAELGAERTLVVSDPGIIAAGHTDRGCAALDKSGIDHRIFSDIQENPTTVHVDHGVEVAKSYGPDLIIGLGGGSSMDCAKGINFLYSGGGRMQDYWGIGKATKPMLPMIAVPTTAGTGSEAQSFALISDPQTHAKMACGDKKAAFRIAVLDPKLTLTQPPQVTAVTGLDAIAHAVETFVCNKRNRAVRPLRAGCLAAGHGWIFECSRSPP